MNMRHADKDELISPVCAPAEHALTVPKHQLPEVSQARTAGRPAGTQEQVAGASEGAGILGWQFALVEG